MPNGLTEGSEGNKVQPRMDAHDDFPVYRIWVPRPRIADYRYLVTGKSWRDPGTASALIGALQFGVGAAVMAVSGVFADGAPKPMVIGIAISAVIAFAIARFTLSTENSRLPAEADCPG